MTRLHRLARQSVDHWVPIAAISTLMAVGVYLARAHITGTHDFRFLVWNLALAWVPYGAALLATAAHRRDQPGHLLGAAALWLVFLPNAPYIVTDFVHLRSGDSPTWWMDLGLVLSFAWAGCVLAAVSLHLMQRVAAERAGGVAAGALVVGAAGVCGLGIYLGRFVGWNSWDLLIKPGAVLTDTAAAVSQPRAAAAMAFFAMFVLMSYLTFAWAARPRRV